jgi:N,N'-diacetyllegionaminate synthase
MTNFANLQHCYLIAEIGVNHNGDMGLAKKMIDEAINSGADAVKFQTFNAELLVSKATPKVRYQQVTTSPDETHYEMIKKLELSVEQHFFLKDYCDEKGVDFISTPYDQSSVDLLERLGVQQYKIASADLVDLELLRYVASTNKPVLLSVGMASLGEVEDAIETFSSYDQGDLLLMHCVSNYPCTDVGLNLNVINTLQSAFGYQVGYSDHSIGSQSAVLSVALGVKVIEKHFTLDKSFLGPDHKASSTPEEFLALSKAVRRAELMLGNGVKRCQPEELEMATVSRKSIILARNIECGDIIKRDDLIMMRPGTGLMPKEVNKVIGKKARYNLSKNHVLLWDDIEK